jgi:hypothetical protein
MSRWIREISASVVCIILMAPLTLVGLLIGKATYFIYNDVMHLNIPDLLTAFGPALIGGAIAGLGATYISVRIIKPQRRKVFLVLPLIALGIAILGSAVGVIMLGNPWLEAVEPTANAVGAIMGLLYMSKDIVSAKI